MLTREEKRKVERIRRDPKLNGALKGTDEEILAKFRFVEDGSGIKTYNSVEEFREATGIDEIEEQ